MSLEITRRTLNRKNAGEICRWLKQVVLSMLEPNSDHYDCTIKFRVRDEVHVTVDVLRENGAE